MPQKPLYSIARIQEILDKYGLKADKRFGQNFLIDANVLNKIIASAQITNNDLVLEVGPGLGVLSYELAKNAAKLVSIELDKRLIEVVNENLAEFDNFEIINQDALDYDFKDLPKDSLLVANLPYNVATLIIVNALESQRFKRLVFLVQKEVAQRLAALPASKNYGALSLIVQYYGQVKKIADVSPNSFFPAPKVTSSIVRIDLKENLKPNPELFEFIHIAFKHRRKTLKKNLIMADYSPEQVLAAIEKLNLKSTVRAEELSLEDFINLEQELA